MTHDEIMRALDVADGPEWTHSILEALYEALKWRPIILLSDTHIGRIELDDGKGKRLFALCERREETNERGERVTVHTAKSFKELGIAWFREALPGPVSE